MSQQDSKQVPAISQEYLCPKLPPPLHLPLSHLIPLLGGGGGGGGVSECE